MHTRKRFMGIVVILLCIAFFAILPQTVITNAYAIVGKYEQLSAINISNMSLRSESKTPILNKDEARVFNIKKALSVINGLIVYPEQSVSFNELTGPRTEKEGYKTSVVIDKGEYTLGAGGGVCQVTTTLYNALVLADIFINEVHNHSLKPSYIQMSFDAMVNYPYYDLKFTNTTGGAIKISASVKDNCVQVCVYGEKMNYYIERQTAILKVLAPKTNIIIDTNDEYKNVVSAKSPTYMLKYPSDGYLTAGYLVYKRGDRVLGKVKARTDWYSPIDGVEVWHKTYTKPC